MKFPILFTIPNFVSAGSGRVMLNILERLDREKFEPAVCVLRKGGRLEEEIKRLDITYLESPFAIPARPYHSLPYRAWRAAQVFRPYRFALWHSFHYLDDYTEPLIARLAGVKHWVYTKKAMGWGSRGWLLRSYLSTGIVADNSEMRRVMFDRAGLRRKVKVIHHGIPTDEYAPVACSELGIRQKLGLSGEETLLGTVAHLVPVKGHPTLLRALSLLPDVHLLIAGHPTDQQYAALLQRLVEELKLSHRVHFLGKVDNVPELLAELDVFVLPTWARWRMEGCPVALLEAMACARACVATDIPGSRDLIEHGKSGLLVPPEDATALAHALESLIGSTASRRALGEAARERAVQLFSIEKEVAAHEALYSEILGLN